MYPDFKELLQSFNAHNVNLLETAAVFSSLDRT